METNGAEEGGIIHTESGSMMMYREAVNEFSVRAREFLECIPVLAKAREAYQRAMTISSELRSTLDAGDEALRTLMNHMEQVLSVQVGRPLTENNGLEIGKVQAIRSDGKSGSAHAA